MKRVADDVLKRHRLRRTPSRKEILGLFFDHDYALSQGIIEQRVSQASDRVTVYRTLKTFLDKGLIHKVLDTDGGLRYARCNETCVTSNHHHEHVHFKCTQCNQTSCLNVTIPTVALPKGFRAKESNLLIQGVCGSCE
jgi:Fur family transcriptional regulator, ferric uptake regulator